MMHEPRQRVVAVGGVAACEGQELFEVTEAALPILAGSGRFQQPGLVEDRGERRRQVARSGPLTPARKPADELLAAAGEALGERVGSRGRPAPLARGARCRCTERREQGEALRPREAHAGEVLVAEVGGG